MKISNSKKELARIISENGGWREGAKWAIQHGNGCIAFTRSHNKPLWEKDNALWGGSRFFGGFNFRKLHQHHQNALSSAEYFHLYPAQDAPKFMASSLHGEVVSIEGVEIGGHGKFKLMSQEWCEKYGNQDDDGWIEWRGGECPVGEDASIDIKLSVGGEFFNVDSDWDWSHDVEDCKVIAYRLHKPEQSKPEFCESVMRSIPEPEYKPSIEQLMQIHCDRAHALSEKKAELFVAERQESEALDALKAACKEAGFDISPIDKLPGKQEPELAIADWRDLWVGDVIELTGSANPCWKEHSGSEMTVKEVYRDQGDNDDQVDLLGESGVWSLGGNTTWRFIRRP